MKEVRGAELTHLSSSSPVSSSSPMSSSSPVLTVTHVLIVACVHSWALAVIREPPWPFWLVVGRVRRGSWAMVKRAHRWVVVTACGQWMVAGDRSRAAVGRCGCCLCPSVGAGRHLWAVVAGCGRLWLGGRFWAVVVVFVNKRKERRGLPELMSTVTTAPVITVWTMWHVH